MSGLSLPAALEGASGLGTLLVERLATASVAGALFAGAVWLVCRRLPALPPTLRCSLWWLVAAKLLVALALPPVELPLLPAPELDAPVATTVAGPVSARATAAESAPAARLAAPPEALPRHVSPAGAPADSPRLAWPTLLAAVWLAGLAAGLLLLGRELVRLRELRRSSRPLVSGPAAETTTALARRLGLARTPALALSDRIATPQVSGIRRPLVLLPTAAVERLGRRELEMALCHELLHVRRRDLALGWLPALAEKIFFFHPLARLAGREYALAREAACDAGVLEILGTAPRAYGRFLLNWGVAPRESGLAAAGAAASLVQLKRRLEMLRSSPIERRRPAWRWALLAAALLALVPLRIVAAPPEPPPAPEAPAAPAPDTPRAPAADPAPAVAPAPLPPAPPLAPGSPLPELAPLPTLDPRPELDPLPRLAPLDDTTPLPDGRPGVVPLPHLVPLPSPAPLPPAPPPAPRAAPAPPPPAPTALAQPSLGDLSPPGPPPASLADARGVRRLTAPGPPVPPRPRAASGHRERQGSGFSYHWSSDDEGLILIDGDADVWMMHGNSSDVVRARALRGDSDEPILWFRRDGKAWVVRDAATIAEVQRLYEPVRELGRRQGELGRQQGELGRQQGELGGRQGRLGAEQARLGAELARLSAEAARRGRDADHSDLDRQRKEIGQQMEALAGRQTELGSRQQALGKRQEELGERQAELGRRQERVQREAQTKLRDVLDRAIASGAAERAD